MDSKTIIVNKKRIEVSIEVYEAYHQEREHERYLNKLAKKNNVPLNVVGDDGNEITHDVVVECDSVEETVIRKVMIEHLCRGLEQLTTDDMFLINAIFFEGKSEREISKSEGIPLMTINNRKRRILSKLKKVIEN
jgi:DNA-directed RNA polymerase specialized sigma24 family protein